METRSKKSIGVCVALLLIGVMVGGGLAYVLLQPQISGLESQVGQLRSNLEKAQAPQIPSLVPVTLNSSSTALLLLDFDICNSASPVYSVYCATSDSSVRNATALLNNAKNSKIQILFTTAPGHPQAGVTIPLDINCTMCTVIPSYGADKFYNTTLDSWLKTNQVKTVVLAGGVTNGAILYTAFEANLRGLTVVVAADGTFRANSQIQSSALFQLLNQPGFANPQNQPLAVLANGRHTVTISATNLITFK